MSLFVLGRRWLLYLILCLGVLPCFGQKHDYNWLFGYGNEGTPDTNFGGATLLFNDSGFVLTKHLRIADFQEDNVSYSDDDGKLLFYSNGDDVFDSRDSVMLNGDSLNLSWFWSFEISANRYRYPGFTITQGMLALPSPADSSKVYLCHLTNHRDIFQGGFEVYTCDSSFYSIIDLGGNNGLGEVISKNVLINSDTLTSGCFSATRHGNGRDWWILHPYWQGNNCYYEFLLNDTGIGLYNIQCLGPEKLYDGALPSSCFSPDGSKYFWVDAGDGIRMFDFDRCTGTLSNPQIIAFPYPGFGDSVTLASGIAVSANNQYLYIAANVVVLQYDLFAADISSSVDTVGIWDHTYDPSPPFAIDFFSEQLGPDGKIYINSADGVKHLSVINKPDFPRDSCMFTQHSLDLTTYNASSLPNFPNYRLGALKDSPCDTLNTMTEDIRTLKEQILKVFPNPASDYTIIDYGFTDWNKGQVSLEICNALGQIVYTQQLPVYSGFQKIDISLFASGVYTAFIKRNGAVVATANFVRE